MPLVILCPNCSEHVIIDLPTAAFYPGSWTSRCGTVIQYMVDARCLIERKRAQLDHATRLQEGDED